MFTLAFYQLRTATFQINYLMIFRENSKYFLPKTLNHVSNLDQNQDIYFSYLNVIWFGNHLSEIFEPSYDGKFCVFYILDIKCNLYMVYFKISTVECDIIIKSINIYSA